MFEISLRPRYSWDFSDAQWVENFDADADGKDDQFAYGELDSQTLDPYYTTPALSLPRIEGILPSSRAGRPRSRTREQAQARAWELVPSIPDPSETAEKAYSK